MPLQRPQRQLANALVTNTLLVGTLVLGIGSLGVQPAQAQMSRSAFRETARELNLSRSQMQSVAGIMRDFSDEIQDILTPEQFELLQSTREQQASQPEDTEMLKEALALTQTQSTQLAVVREEMVTGLKEVLEPYQLEGIMEMTAFSQLSSDER
ncbi:MAG: hypothetical protein AAFO06_18580 [Cyanobacteria bacterium J06597_16]